MVNSHPLAGKATFAVTVVTPEEDFLRIPDHFVKKYLSFTPQMLKIYSDDGLRWDVDIKERKGSLYISTGWADFKTCYGLTHHDQLLFIYESGDTMYVCLNRANGEAVKKSVAELIVATDPVEMERYRINLRILDGHVEIKSTEGVINAGDVAAGPSNLHAASIAPQIASVNSRKTASIVTPHLLAGLPVRELAFGTRSTPTSPVTAPTDAVAVDTERSGSSSKRAREENSEGDAVVPTYSDQLRAAVKASKKKRKELDRKRALASKSVGGSRKVSAGGSSSGRGKTEDQNEVNELIEIEDDERMSHCKVILSTHDVLATAKLVIPFPFGHSNLKYGCNTLVLRVASGKEWPIIAVLDDEIATIEVGWSKFSEAHNLLPGDTIVLVQNMVQKKVWEVVITEGLGA